MARTSKSAFAVIVATAMLLAFPVPAQDQAETERAPMIFGAASNFSQGFRPAIFDAAQDLPLKHYRDGMRWGDVERRPGVYRFRNARLDYPARLEQRGHELVLTVNWGNPLYDGGFTPHSPEGLQALTDYVEALVTRYPAITAIEVGNEVNGANFVSGPVLEAGIAERGRYHLAMVRAAREGAKAARPDIRILGGSTHSLPAGFLWPILDEGPQLLDGLALHPYTTPSDQLSTQIGVLRRHPAARNMPIAITEWGSASRKMAPHDMLRGYATFAALGVESLYWYPLNERGDGLVPLIERDGTISEAGESFGLIQRELGGRVARDVSPDDFTFAITFGPDRLVLWGEPRSVSLRRSDIEAWDARGNILPRDSLRLAPDQPILLRSDRPFALGSDVELGCSELIADTFYQFSYDPARETGLRWQPFISHNGEPVPFKLMPGQQQGGVPWNPYLGHPQVQALRLNAETLQSVRKGDDLYAIAHSFTAPKDMLLFLEFAMKVRGDEQPTFTATFAMPDPPYNGVVSFSGLEIGHNLSVRAGEEIIVAAHPDPGQRTAPASYRLRLFDLWACPQSTDPVEASGS